MGRGPDIFFHPLANPGLIGDDRWEVIPSEPPPDQHKWVNAHRRMAKSMMDMLEGKAPEWGVGATSRREAPPGNGHAGPRVTYARCASVPAVARR